MGKALTKRKKFHGCRFRSFGLGGQGLDQFQRVVVALRSFRPDLFRYHRLCITDYIV